MSEPLKHPALLSLKTERDDVFAFEFDGHLSQEEVDEVYETLERAYDTYGTINLLIRVGRFDGFDWNSLLSGSTYIGKLHALKHLRRYALVGGPEWFATATRFFNSLFRVEVRHFEFDDEASAWRWVYEEGEEQPAEA